MRHDLNDAKVFLPVSNNYHGIKSDVSISKTNFKVAHTGVKKEIISLRFYGKYHKLFKNHKLIVYLFDDCVAVKLSNDIGYTYHSMVYCKSVGEIRCTRKTFVQNIKKNVGHYDLHYDEENDAYFLYFNERKENNDESSESR